jgi:hypothetical protein
MENILYNNNNCLIEFKKYGKSFNEAMGITDLMMGEGSNLYFSS